MHDKLHERTFILAQYEKHHNEFVTRQSTGYHERDLMESLLSCSNTKHQHIEHVRRSVLCNKRHPQWFCQK